MWFDKNSTNSIKIIIFSSIHREINKLLFDSKWDRQFHKIIILYSINNTIYKSNKHIIICYNLIILLNKWIDWLHNYISMIFYICYDVDEYINIISCYICDNISSFINNNNNFHKNNNLLFCKKWDCFCFSIHIINFYIFDNIIK